MNCFSFKARPEIVNLFSISFFTKSHNRPSPVANLPIIADLRPEALGLKGLAQINLCRTYRHDFTVFRKIVRDGYVQDRD